MATMTNLRYIPPILRFTDWGVYYDAGADLYLGIGSNGAVSIQDNIRYPCLNDSNYRQLALARCTEIAQRFSKQSSSEYFYNQESCFSQSWHRGNSGVCYCPACKNYFRNYLIGKYNNNINLVNQEYGTSYTSFSEIEPPFLSDITSSNSAMGACWADFRLCMCKLYNDFYVDMTSAINAVQANAKTGIAAPISYGLRAGEAVDLWQFSQWMKVKFPYYSFSQVVYNNFAPQDSLLGQGTSWGPAYSRSPEYAKWMVWNNLFTGNNFHYLYYGDTGFATSIANDYTVFSDLQVLLNESMKVKSGIGKLINEASPASPGVVMLYSISSIINQPLLEKLGHTCTITGIKRFGMIDSDSYSNNYMNWIKMLQNCNIPCKIISY